MADNWDVVTRIIKVKGLGKRPRSSVVEHFLGKEGVASSTLAEGSIFPDPNSPC